MSIEGARRPVDYSPRLERIVTGRRQIQDEGLQAARAAADADQPALAVIAARCVIEIPDLSLGFGDKELQVTLEHIDPGVTGRVKSDVQARIQALRTRMPDAQPFADREFYSSVTSDSGIDMTDPVLHDRMIATVLGLAANGLEFEGMSDGLRAEAFRLPPNLHVELHEIETQSREKIGDDPGPWVSAADRMRDEHEYHGVGLAQREAGHTFASLDEPDKAIRAYSVATYCLNRTASGLDLSSNAGWMLSAEVDIQRCGIFRDQLDVFRGKPHAPGDSAHLRSLAENMIRAGVPPSDGSYMGEPNTGSNYRKQLGEVAQIGHESTDRLTPDRRFFRKILRGVNSVTPVHELLENDVAVFSYGDPLRNDPLK